MVKYGQLSTDVNKTKGILKALDNPRSIASPISLEKTPNLRYFDASDSNSLTVAVKNG